MTKRRRRFVFSLRTFLVCVTLLALLGGRWLMRASEQRRAYQTLMACCEEEHIICSITTTTTLPFVERFVSTDDDQIWHALEQIERVELSNSDDGWYVSDEITECLQHFAGLTRLSLNDVSLSRRGLEALQRTSIENLSFWSVTLVSPWHETDAIHLPPKLRTLSIRGWSGDLSVYSSLDRLTELEELVITGATLCDDQMTRICKLTKLRTLRLRGNLAISSDGLLGIKNLRDLSILELDCAESLIDDSVVNAIASLPELWSLTIAAANASSSSWSKLGDCNSLERLYLVGCPRDESNLAGIAEIKQLERIGFEDWGKPVSEKVLGHLKEMNRLEFVHEPFSNVSFRGAKQLLELPMFFRVYENPGNDDYFGRTFLYLATGDDRGTFDHWQLLLSDYADLSGEMGFLQYANSVSRIDLRRTDVGDGDMVDVARTPQLSELMIGGTRVTDNGISALGKATLLEILHANDLSLTCENFPAFAELRELELSGSDITLSGWAAIAKLPALEELSVTGGGISKQVCSELAKLPSLRKLALEHCDIQSNALSSLAPCTSLEELWLEGVVFQDPGSTGIGSLQQLGLLDLEATNANDETVNQLASLNSLKRLNLESTEVGDGSFQLLVSFSSLQLLEIDETEFSRESVAKLCDAIGGVACAQFPNIRATNQPLHRLIESQDGWLFLSHTRVDDNSMPLLAAQKDVYTIELADTAVTDAGIQELAESESITAIDLSGTRVTKSGIESLSPIADRIYKLKLNRTSVDAGVLDELKDWSILAELELGATSIDFQTAQKRFPVRQLRSLTVADGEFDRTALGFASRTAGVAQGSVSLDGRWWNWDRAQGILGNRYLQYVHVRDTSLGDRSVDLVCSLPFVAAVDWDSELPTPDAIRRLADCKFLHSVRVGDTAIAQEQLDAIASLPQVRTVELAHIENVESLNFDVLADSSSLNEVEIIDKRISLHFGRSLKETFNKHVRLSLSDYN